jgi:hypothetical protein
VGAAAPAQFSDVDPGDTAAVIAMMRSTMRNIDSVIIGLTPQDTTISLAGDSLARHLTLWLDHGVPRKLVAMNADTTATNRDETDIWFVGGDVAVVQQLADVLAFDAGRIVLWTDETFVPRDQVTQEVAMNQQAKIMAQIESWTSVFGVRLP